MCWFQICLISTHLTNDTNWTNITIKPTILRKTCFGTFSKQLNKQTNIQVFCWAFVQVYTQNGVTTLALSMDDYGRTELTEAFQQRCFDFIARGLEERREEDGMFFFVWWRWKVKKPWEKTWGKFATCPCLRSLKHSPWGLKNEGVFVMFKWDSHCTTWSKQKSEVQDYVLNSADPEFSHLPVVVVWYRCFINKIQGN